MNVISSDGNGAQYDVVSLAVIQLIKILRRISDTGQILLAMSYRRSTLVHKADKGTINRHLQTSSVPPFGNIHRSLAANICSCQ